MLRWSFGTNRIQLKADLQAVEELAAIVESDLVSFSSASTSSSFTAINTLPRASKCPSLESEDIEADLAVKNTGRTSPSRAKEEHSLRKELLEVLLSDEADRLKLWLNPAQDSKRGPILSPSQPSPDVRLFFPALSSSYCRRQLTEPLFFC